MSFLEEKLLEIINFKNGFYIECGSNDGLFQTNTYTLETEYNWKGLLIDASESSFNACKLNRNNYNNVILNCGLVAFNYDKDYVCGDFADGSPMSSVDGKRLNRPGINKISARTIDSILKEYDIKHVDLFVIDVEGYEYNVLNGLDFEYCSPKYLLIEIYNFDLEKIHNFLINKNYELVCNLSGYNYRDNPKWDGTHNDYLYKIKE